MAVTVRTLLFQILPVFFVLVMMAVSFILINLSTKNPLQAESYGAWIFPINSLIALMLVSLIVYNGYKLYGNLRSRRAGSRFNGRLMSAFALLTILPTLIVSYFSMNFIGDRIDGWFDVRIEGSLEDSIELSRSSLNVRMRQHLLDLERAARAMIALDELDYRHFLDRQYELLAPYELVLLNSKQRILFYRGQDAESILPSFPADSIYRKLNNRGYINQLEPAANGGLFSRVALTMKPAANKQTYVLSALFEFSEKERSLSDSVQTTLADYKRIQFQKSILKRGFRYTLAIIMLFSMLLSLWAAFIYSQRLTAPVRNLLKGTLAVASGDLNKKIDVSEKSDFGLLARSFNSMTKKLSEAQRQSEASQRYMQQQNDYLNIVLNHLNSGVITLDERHIIKRSNQAANQVLGFDLAEYHGQKLSVLCDTHDYLLAMLNVIHPLVHSDEPEWQVEVPVLKNHQRQVLVCRGALLPGMMDKSQGHVLLFDDITDVIKAEHDAAWGEVARRLAHEIKNPLTPIQLSAERLQHRLKPQLQGKDAELLSRMSNTIVDQVDTLKKMVNAFSEYARSPELSLTKGSINDLVREVVELYQNNELDAKIELELSTLPDLPFDKDRLRQVLVNLIKNAFEAMNDIPQPEIVIVTRLEGNRIILDMTDNGQGFPDDLLPDVFTPYVTSKEKGSGLGLAIVKKIVEEHEGFVEVRNNQRCGATISLILPLDTVKTQGIAHG